MKYKQLKDLPWSPKGTVWEAGEKGFVDNFSFNPGNRPNWFEPIEEECDWPEKSVCHKDCKEKPEGPKRNKIEKLTYPAFGTLEHSEEMHNKINEIIDRINNSQLAMYCRCGWQLPNDLICQNEHCKYA